jgi:hypothetical protein
MPLSAFDCKNVNTVSAVSKGSDKKVYLNFKQEMICRKYQIIYSPLRLQTEM